MKHQPLVLCGRALGKTRLNSAGLKKEYLALALDTLDEWLRKKMRVVVLDFEIKGIRHRGSLLSSCATTVGDPGWPFSCLI